jgi:DNA-binding transcriptional LysR family regulator
MDDVFAGARLEYLHTFHTVATLGGVTRAAAALHLSQPAVSGRLRALERHYGAPLLLVRHRRMRLTAEGEALHACTARVFNLLRAAQRTIAAVRDAARGHLAVGASTTVGIYLLPAVLGDFVRERPGVEVSLAVGTSAEVRDRVLRDDAPIGLVEAPVPHPDLESVPFAADEVVLIAPPGHPLARAGRVALDDLQGQRVLWREATSGTRAFVVAALARAGVAIEAALELGSTEAQKQAVLAGLGVAWVSRMTVRREVAAGELVVVETPGLDLTRRLLRIAPRGVPLPAAAAAFLRLLDARAPALAAPPAPPAPLAP